MTEVDAAGITDVIVAQVRRGRPLTESAGLTGRGVAELYGPDGVLKQRVEFTNLVTQQGDLAYGERGAGLGGAPAAPTGMQLGTGTTAVAKTGAGAAIVTLVTASLVAVATPTSALNAESPPGRSITYVTTWVAGTATSNGIAEVALVNQSTGTQTAAPASATYARALLSPVVDKAAADSLVVTWIHNLKGS